MQLTMRELFRLGGWAMWPLLVFSVATVAIILERTLYILRHHLGVREIAELILAALKDEDWKEARDLCEQAPRKNVAARIFRVAFESLDLDDHRMEGALEAAAAKQIQSLEKGFDLLVAIGSIAPITGFLGTVSGMIGAFRNIAQSADVNAQLVAGGIFEALITTAYGLTIAIAAISAYNIFVHIVDRFAASVEEAGNDILTSLLRLRNNGKLPQGKGLPPVQKPPVEPFFDGTRMAQHDETGDTDTLHGGISQEGVKG